jgi:hypothetical protein
MKMNSTNGPWDSIAALQSAVPAASNAGSVQLVGAQPYMAVNGAWVSMGLTYTGSTISPVLGSSVINQLPKFKAGLQRVAQRKGRPLIVLVNGDSTEIGFNVATGTNGFVGARKSTHAAQLARMLGWQDSGCVGAGCGTDVALNLYDERVSFSGAGLSVNYSIDALGAAWVQFANASTGVYTITPRGNKGYDRVRVVYGRFSSGGASLMKVTVGGTSIGTFVAQGGSGAGDTQSVEFSCAYSGPSTPIAISGNSGTTDGQCLIIAVIWYDSTDPGVIVLNGGSSGAKASNLVSTSNPWSQTAARAAIAPELNIINCWINDTYYTTAPATYTTNLTTFKNANSPTSDIVYMGYQPINDASMSNGQGDAIFAAMNAVAAGAPVVDLRAVFGPTFAAANALGIYADTLHITALGQYYKAAYTASLLVN